MLLDEKSTSIVEPFLVESSEYFHSFTFVEIFCENSECLVTLNTRWGGFVEM